MKKIVHIKKRLTLASLVGLIALLLLSPCKIRNAVQTALELPKTEVSSKSICQVYEDIKSVVSVTKVPQQNASAILKKEAELTFVALDLSQHTSTHFKDKSESVSVIPYYILYQNLKVYL